MKKILAIIAIVSFAFAIPSCKGKSDADLKAEVDGKLMVHPEYASVTTSITNGDLTLSGTVPDDAAKASVETAVKEIKGVKSVVNNTSVPPPPPPVTINPDDQLRTSLQDALKDHPTVTATVADGVVTLTGEVKKADLPKVMQKVNATKPKKVEQKLTVK